MVQQLVTAGLLELFTDDDGDEAMRLTPDGEKIARQLALGVDEDALLEALLGECRKHTDERRCFTRAGVRADPASHFERASSA